VSPTPCKARCTGASGFTLLELMLAIVIVALLLASVYGALSRTTS
jgi:prepilin-type N-terminal cleavage/methylation domain-containing protein